ncbi:MAG: lipoyl(octanoyl) transferase LipB [Candidatus Omnitrophica bacterium]|nr:lipoyl(octanoyl) transferase LipB [Candidatus Omnitrophota bacterium]
MRISVVDLGKISFQKAFLRQLDIQKQVLEGEVSHTLVFCEHPHTITSTRRTDVNNILDHRFILDNNVDYVMGINRGGDITYHGPGQLMGYLIFDLRNLGRDLGLFLRNMESSIIKTLAAFNIEACSKAGFRGVWAGDKKIASIGIGVNKWVTIHGFGLNVNTELKFFEIIRPCGLDIKMTSMKKELRGSLNLGLVKKEFARALNDIFNPDSLNLTCLKEA